MNNIINRIVSFSKKNEVKYGENGKKLSIIIAIIATLSSGLIFENNNNKYDFFDTKIVANASETLNWSSNLPDPIKKYGTSLQSSFGVIVTQSGYTRIDRVNKAVIGSIVGGGAYAGITKVFLGSFSWPATAVSTITSGVVAWVGTGQKNLYYTATYQWAKGTNGKYYTRIVKKFYSDSAFKKPVTKNGTALVSYSNDMHGLYFINTPHAATILNALYKW
jgi:hypothetical protein